MRPSNLHYFFKPASSIRGVGVNIFASLGRLFNKKTPLIKDLIFHIATDFLDRRKMPPLYEARDGTTISTIIIAEEYHEPQPRSRQPFKVICKNETGYLTLIFFRIKENYIISQLPIGQKRIISGKIERFDGVLQMSHPDYIAPITDIDKILRLEPIYPLTRGLTQARLGGLIENAVQQAPDLPEWISPTLMQDNKWCSWKKSLEIIHSIGAAQSPNTNSTTKLQNNPVDKIATDKNNESNYNNALSRLAYDELLANQLSLSLARSNNKKKAGHPQNGDNSLRQKLISTLPFALTDGQNAVLSDIYNDMANKQRMVRLLQGDVGSGKTVVALLAALNIIECAGQVAIMAPTEILARQHFEWIVEIITKANIDINISALTGRDKGKSRTQILNDLAAGETQIIIGTHALFQKDVIFKNLSFIVIDEQHRFGVEQRSGLAKKGHNPDILLMTATPIPRTLTLTMYGDMDISSLKEKPAFRKEIDTRILPISRADDVVQGLKRSISNGDRIYWVCPLIEEAETDAAIDIATATKTPKSTIEQKQLAAAEARYNSLSQYFPDKVGIVHGKMKSDIKDAIMVDFKNGKLDILVATTVIEVGINVPEATIMVIEQAENFGLSQLHQLRGRVGRGSKQSSCVLLYGNMLSKSGKKRLQIMRETNDGFRIAEEDLLIRGGGEILGTKQSGMPDFSFALLPEHNDLLLTARKDTKIIINQDPELTTKRGNNLRTLLHLFGYDKTCAKLASQ